MASPPPIQAPNRLPAISREALQQKKKTQEALSYQVRVLYVQFGVERHDGHSFIVAWEGDYNSEEPAKPGTRQKGLFKELHELPRRYNDVNSILRLQAKCVPKFQRRTRRREPPISSDRDIRQFTKRNGTLAQTDESKLIAFFGVQYRSTIPMGQIRSVQSVWDRMPFIIMRLYNPPSFEAKAQLASLTGDPKKGVKHSWQRLSSLQGAPEPVVAFASRTIRLVFASDPKHMKNFLRMSQFSRLPSLAISLHGNPTYGGLFLGKRRGDPKKKAPQVPWAIAFQRDALLENGILLPREITNLKDGIERLLAIGARFAEEVLRLVSDIEALL